MKRVLFIGNSFTYFNDLPGTLQTLAEGKLEVGSVTRGGWYLHRYLDPEDKMYEPTMEALKETWDAVVLQEQSSFPFREYDNYVDSVRRFRKLLGDTPIYLYQTWTYEPGTDKLATTGMSASEMYEALKNAAHGAAEAIGATVVPVGDAQFAALNDSDIKLYRDDHYHPSPALTYLAAATFYGVLCGESPMMMPAIDELSAEDCEALRRYAAHAL